MDVILAIFGGIACFMWGGFSVALIQSVGKSIFSYIVIFFFWVFAPLLGILGLLSEERYLAPVVLTLSFFYGWKKASDFAKDES